MITCKEDLMDTKVYFNSIDDEIVGLYISSCKAFGISTRIYDENIIHPTCTSLGVFMDGELWQNIHSSRDLKELRVSDFQAKPKAPFLQTGEDFEHTKTLNFIRDRLVEVHSEPKNLDYMHKLNNAIAFVERMEDVKKNCGGIEPKVLRGAVEIKQEKPKRTKVSHEKVDCKQFEFWECAKEYQSKMHIYWKDSKGKFVIQDLNQLVEQYKTGVIYRRVETETTEREEFIDELTSIQKVLGDCHLSDYYDALYDSGKFKLVN